MPRHSNGDQGHLPLRWLADHVDGTLHAARASKLTSHLALGCARCTARLTQLRSTITALTDGPLDEPPRNLRRAAQRLPGEARLAALGSRIRRVIAHLVSDGRTAPAFALRAAVGDERRLLWSADGWEIDACVVSGASGADLLGQILPCDDGTLDGAEDVAVASVTARSGRRVRHAALAPEGRFTLRELATGLWTIEARIGNVAVVLPAFVVEGAS